MNLGSVSGESPISVPPPLQENPKTAAGPSVPAARIRRLNARPSLDALIAQEGHIEKVFYPVFPPDQNAQKVLAWIGKNA